MQWRQSRWGPGVRTPPTFSPARVRILVDPGSIFTKYKYIIKLGLATSYRFLTPKSNITSCLLNHLVADNKYSDSKFSVPAVANVKLTISSVICSGSARNFFLGCKPLPPFHPPSLPSPSSPPSLSLPLP